MTTLSNGLSNSFCIPLGATIFNATTTPEKIIDFNLASKALGMDVQHVSIGVFNPLCNSPVEDQRTFAGNAEKKLHYAMQALAAGFNEALKNKGFKQHLLKEYAINVEGENHYLYAGVEDSGISLGIPWLRDYLDGADIEKHLDKINPGGDIPGVETGPIIRDSGGEEAFYGRVKAAIIKASHDEQHPKIAAEAQKILYEGTYQAVSSSTYSIARLKINGTHPVPEDETSLLNASHEGRMHTLSYNPQHDIKTFVSNVPVVMSLEPTKFLADICHKNGHPAAWEIVTSDHYMRMNHEGKTIAEINRGENHHYTKEKSARANNMRQLQAVAFGKTVEQPVKATPNKEQPYKIVLMGGTTHDLSMLKKQMRETGAEQCEITHVPLSISGKNLNSEIRQADAFVLCDSGKMNSKNYDSMLEAFDQQYVVSSLIVAKQLQPSCADKAIMLWNRDSKMQGTVSVLAEMMKERLMGGSIGLDTDMAYYDPRNFFEIRNQLPDIANFLKYKAKNYQRIKEPRLPDQGKMTVKLAGTEENITVAPKETVGKMSGRYNVLVCCSSASENKGYLTGTSQLTYDHARAGIGVISGLGSRNMMGAINIGVERWDAECLRLESTKNTLISWMGGSSTAIIVSREGENGLPPMNQHLVHLAPHINGRKRFLFENTDASEYKNGGPGTLQEFAYRGRNALRNKAFMCKGNEIGAPLKKAVLINATFAGNPQQGCWDTELKTLVGKNPDEALDAADFTKLERAAIYVANTDSESAKMLEQFREQETKSGGKFVHATCAEVAEQI